MVGGADDERLCVSSGASGPVIVIIEFLLLIYHCHYQSLVEAEVSSGGTSTCRFSMCMQQRQGN